jgi:hypothetical protein
MSKTATTNVLVDRTDDMVTVHVFGIPARHTTKRFEKAREKAYGMLHEDEIRDMSLRKRHFEVELHSQAFETYRFKIKEVSP